MQSVVFNMTIKRLPAILALLVAMSASCVQAAPLSLLPQKLARTPPSTPPSPPPQTAPSAIDTSHHCRNSLNSPIILFCEVAPGILWRGAKPDEQGAAWLVAHGVRTVVNLELLHDDLANFGVAKNDVALKTDIQYFRLRDWEPLAIFAPSIKDQNVAQFLAIMQQSPKPVYVHCRSGQNRTGVMVAAYRLLVENADLEKTIAEMKQYHGFWSFADARYLRGLVQRREEILRQANVNLPTRNAQIICTDGICKIELLDR